MHQPKDPQTMQFRVQLDAFAGPLDLLLYLIRKNEVDVRDIPIAEIADQFLEVLEVLEQIDFDAVGEFLELAVRMIEIKSQMVLPRQEDENEEQELDDPRRDLVQRLLEYKRYRDAAAALEERRRDWQQRFARRSLEVNDRSLDPADQPIQELELWDLVSAFSRVMRDNAATQPANIRYDDTPIEVYAEMIRDRLRCEPKVRFEALFDAGANRSKLIGVFLALLELIRGSQATAEQAENFSELWICRGLKLTDGANAAPAQTGDLSSSDASAGQ